MDDNILCGHFAFYCEAQMKSCKIATVDSGRDTLSDDLDKRARRFAETYLLIMLVELHKRDDPEFGKKLVAAFDAFLGEHMKEWNDLDAVLPLARDRFKTLVDNYLLIPPPAPEPKTLRRKFLRWLQQ